MGNENGKQRRTGDRDGGTPDRDPTRPVRLRRGDSNSLGGGTSVDVHPSHVATDVPEKERSSLTSPAHDENREVKTAVFAAEEKKSETDADKFHSSRYEEEEEGEEVEDVIGNKQEECSHQQTVEDGNKLHRPLPVHDTVDSPNVNNKVTELPVPYTEREDSAVELFKLDQEKELSLGNVEKMSTKVTDAEDIGPVWADDMGSKGLYGKSEEGMLKLDGKEALIKQSIEDQFQVICQGVVQYQKSNRQILKLLTERESELRKNDAETMSQLQALEQLLEALKVRSDEKDKAIVTLSKTVDKLTNQLEALIGAFGNGPKFAEGEGSDSVSDQSDDEDDIEAEEVEDLDEEKEDVKFERTEAGGITAEECTDEHSEYTKQDNKSSEESTPNNPNASSTKSSTSDMQRKKSVSVDDNSTKSSPPTGNEWDSHIEWTLPDPVPVPEKPVKEVRGGHWIEVANQEIARGKLTSLDHGPGPSTVLCFDVSNSMKGDPLKQMIILGLRFINGIEKIQNQTADGMKEKVGIVTFGHETAILNHLSTDYRSLKGLIRNLRPGGPSPLGGALALSFGCIRGTMMSNETIPPRVIIFTDGLVTETTITGGPDMLTRSEDALRTLKISAEFRGDQGCLLPQMRNDKIQVYFVPLGAALTEPYMVSVSKATKGKIIQPKSFEKLIKQTHNTKVAVKLAREMKGGKLMDAASLAALVSGQTDADLSEEDLDDILELMSAQSTTADDSDEEPDERQRNRECDPNMPPLGTRVRRGPDWESNWNHQDSNGPGTVVSHTQKGWIWIVWDNGHRNQYPYGKNGNFGVIVADDPRLLKQDQLIEPGCLVVRGPDWRDTEKDGGAGSVGAVFRRHDDATCGVRWPNGNIRRYKFGKEGFFEVTLCDPFDPEVQAAVKSRGKHKVHVDIQAKSARADSDTVNEDDALIKDVEIMTRKARSLSVDEMNRRNALIQREISMKDRVDRKDPETSTAELTSVSNPQIAEPVDDGGKEKKKTGDVGEGGMTTPLIKSQNNGKLIVEQIEVPEGQTVKQTSGADETERTAGGGVETPKTQSFSERSAESRGHRNHGARNDDTEEAEGKMEEKAVTSSKDVGIEKVVVKELDDPGEKTNSEVQMEETNSAEQNDKNRSGQKLDVANDRNWIARSEVIAKSSSSVGVLEGNTVGNNSDKELDINHMCVGREKQSTDSDGLMETGTDIEGKGKGDLIKTTTVSDCTEMPLTELSKKVDDEKWTPPSTMDLTDNGHGSKEPFQKDYSARSSSATVTAISQKTDQNERKVNSGHPERQHSIQSQSSIGCEDSNTSSGLIVAQGRQLSDAQSISLTTNTKRSRSGSSESDQSVTIKEMGKDRLRLSSGSSDNSDVMAVGRDRSMSESAESDLSSVPEDFNSPTSASPDVSKDLEFVNNLRPMAGSSHATNEVPSESEEVTWQKKDDNGGWVNFPPEVSAKLEKAYQRNPNTTIGYTEKNKRFKVMLSNMMLVHPVTKQMTGVRRHVGQKK